MTRVGVAVALPTEARCFGAGDCSPGDRVDRGEGWVAISGVGPARARACAEALVRDGAEAIVSWGTAGGLDPALGPGALVIPARVHFEDESVFEVDADWRTRVKNRLAEGLTFSEDDLVTCRRAAKTPEEKARLFHSVGACAVDMESAALAQVAVEASVPFLALRVVTDDAGTTLPRSALQGVDEAGRVRPLAMLRGLVARPGEIRGLLRLDRGFRAALRTLGRLEAQLEDDLFV